MSRAPEPQQTEVHHHVVVGLSSDDAFSRFLQMDRIKPREHNLLRVPIEETVLEPRSGGDIYDRGVDGSICRWGRVLVFEPPHRLVFSWHIGPDWTIQTDPARTSEVEVLFTPDPSGGTRVDLAHRHLERHGAQWRATRDGVDGAGGWPLYLARYVALTTR